ncbi:MAG: ATP-binding protein [Clostridiales bacterium]|nr:ATP-binding protein [Clostridiales bacterium]
MLKRKVYSELLEWKKRRQDNKKESIIIKGARQVGKTSVVEEFGENEYESFIEIDFIKRPDLKNVFIGSKEPSDIFSKISLYMPNAKIVPGNTLIFLDEIQRCGDARTAIKYLAKDFTCDVISSGSLLSLEYGEDADEGVEAPESIAVGFEYEINMYSLDFEEYLWAKGYDDEQIKYFEKMFNDGEKIPVEINEKMESLFREYMVVGGMPEVVASFIPQGDFNEAFRVQRKIISEYQNDISAHAKGEQKLKVRACYDSVPKQLAREMKRFQYSFVEKKQTSRKYGGSVKWLKDSNLVNVCNNVREPFIPLIANEIEEQFKMYINDTGLLTQMYGRETKIAIINNTIKGNAKGAVYENIISELLIKNGYNLHYYKPNDDQELEFIIEKNSEVVPIEVKAGNTKSISLNKFMKDFSPTVGYKLISGNQGISDKVKTIPHYMVMFI